MNIKRLVAATYNAEYACPDSDTTDTCGWVPHVVGPMVQGGVCTTALTTPPCTGLDTDEVKEFMAQDAVEFFGSRLYGATPPELDVPADMTVNATSPAGATVTFTATATDDVDPDPT